MDAKEFLDTYGKAEAERIARIAGTTLAYFKQIAYGHRKPSSDLAWDLVEASNGRMDFEKLLRKRGPKLHSDLHTS